MEDLNVDMFMFELSEAKDDDIILLYELPERMDVGVRCLDSKQAVVDTPEENVEQVERLQDVGAPERNAIQLQCGFAPGSDSNLTME